MRDVAWLCVKSNDPAGRSASLDAAAQPTMAIRQIAMRQIAMRQIAIRQIAMRQIAIRQIAIRQIAICCFGSSMRSLGRQCA
eukprot:3658944-Pleurochrysis_carterae.AAC.1